MELPVLEEFTLPEWLSDPHALDFIDITAGGLSAEEVRKLAADPDLIVDENEDQDGETEEIYEEPDRA